MFIALNIRFSGRRHSTCKYFFFDFENLKFEHVLTSIYIVETLSDVIARKYIFFKSGNAEYLTEIV